MNTSVEAAWLETGSGPAGLAQLTIGTGSKIMRRSRVLLSKGIGEQVASFALRDASD
jgi:hypothetical protein